MCGTSTWRWWHLQFGSEGDDGEYGVSEENGGLREVPLMVLGGPWK